MLHGACKGADVRVVVVDDQTAVREGLDTLLATMAEIEVADQPPTETEAARPCRPAET